jgi:hypothetical protein
MTDEPLDAIVIESPDAAEAAHASASRSTGEGPTWRQWVDDPWIVLATLFFVTAALGLPLLWVSRAFSPTAKVFWTVAVVLWTALILVLFVLLMWWCYQQIQQALVTASLAL